MNTKPAIKLTKMTALYIDIKAGLPDKSVLLFRLGDFYEAFFYDAVHISFLLDLILTKRGPAPMAGFAIHRAPILISRMLKVGIQVVTVDYFSPGREVKEWTLEELDKP